MTPLEMVREFHEAFSVPAPSSPQLPPQNRRALRWRLMTEEFEELVDAMYDSSLIEVADALADLVVTVYGTALEYGIDLDAVLAEVHRSNMSKLGPDGKPILREDGKVLKGPAYFPPDIQSVLGGVKR